MYILRPRFFYSVRIVYLSTRLISLPLNQKYLFQSIHYQFSIVVNRNQYIWFPFNSMNSELLIGNSTAGELKRLWTSDMRNTCKLCKCCGYFGVEFVFAFEVAFELVEVKMAKLSLLPRTIIFTRYSKSDDLAIITIDILGTNRH